MTKGAIDANKAILQKIFSPDFWFVVPEYQRPYVWQEDNVQELIEDLYYAFENKPNHEYFLGALVLKRTKELQFNEYELLDGQQRLTTLCLMIAVLRDLIEKPIYKSTLSEMVYQEENELRQIPARNRIKYNTRDKVKDFMRLFIVQNEGTKDDKVKELTEHTNTSVSNMAKSLLTMQEIFSQKDNLEEFAIFLLNKVLFIYVSTESTEDAFRLFTILNDRGMPLSHADILKSINIGEVSTEDLYNYSIYWENLEEKHGDKFDRFLSFARTILLKNRQTDNLLDEFEKNIYAKGILRKGKDTIDYLLKIDRIYDEIIDLQSKELTNDYKNLVTIMKLGLQSDEWITPLISYFMKFKHHKIDIFIKKLEYKFIGDIMSNIIPSERTKNLNNIIKAIESKNNVNELLNDKQLFRVDLKAFRKTLNGKIYGKKYAKYLLLKVEYLMSDNTVHLSNYNEITIEHVLPQNPPPKSKWRVDFNDNQRRLWTNRISNLVLISNKKNVKLGNLDFEQKKEKYLKDRMDVFNGSKIFLSKSFKWNEKALHIRQDMLVNMLVNNKGL